ncbi:unnamed protein product [Cuscuta epithymum]|uniref:FLZ-type domain-containing protein n=1 Tax=Cuscuta epithymum TaxID=186058 RepID=A0AAV0FT77_9ASTE|nr:unnamed protein product [Cuscuta epithymum]
MLMKRSRSLKDQQMGNPMPNSLPESYLSSGLLSQKHKATSFFNVPALLVGLNAKHSESDSARSPTSPLEFRVFSSTVGSPLRSQRSHEGTHKSWGCNKVGLIGIIDYFDHKTECQGILPIENRGINVIFGPQMSSKNCLDSIDGSKSLPNETKLLNLHKADSLVLFGSCSLDTGSSLSNFPGIATRNCSLSNPSGPKMHLIPEPSGCITNEIELSEDYTCVRTRGPNPKVTHIFCDCILDCHNYEFAHFSRYGDEDDIMGLSKGSASCEEQHFLSFCYTCKKDLDGKDIYIYRGDKAFCSSACRSMEILIDEEMEKTNNSDGFEKPNKLEECSLFIAV